jgi:sec-independent protein translocase protein TatA
MGCVHRGDTGMSEWVRYAPAMNLGAPELLILLVIILLVFGGTKLPKLARSLGQAQKEFKQGIDEGSTKDD